MSGCLILCVVAVSLGIIIALGVLGFSRWIENYIHNDDGY
jgi:hypothetical protein